MPRKATSRLYVGRLYFSPRPSWPNSTALAQVCTDLTSESYQNVTNDSFKCFVMFLIFIANLDFFLKLFEKNQYLQKTNYDITSFFDQMLINIPRTFTTSKLHQLIKNFQMLTGEEGGRRELTIQSDHLHRRSRRT